MEYLYLGLEKCVHTCVCEHSYISSEFESVWGGGVGGGAIHHMQSYEEHNYFIMIGWRQEGSFA